MSFRLSGKVYLALVVLWVGFMALFLYQQGQFSGQRTRPAAGSPGTGAELSGTASSEGTNTAAAAGPANRLSGLDPAEGSFGTFFPKPQDYGPQDVLPPPQPLPPDRRAEAALDRKKDWAFMTPEELLGLRSTDELFADAESRLSGQRQTKLTPTERLYRSLTGSQEDRSKGGDSRTAEPYGSTGRNDNSPNSLNSPNSREDAKLPGALGETVKNLKTMLASSANSSALGSARGSFVSLFGPEEKGPSPADLKAHQEYMKWYQAEILNMPQSPSSPGPWGGMSTAPLASTTPVLLSRSPAAGTAPQMGSLTPSYLPSTPADISARILHQFDPGYTPPKLAPPAAQPPSPGFTVPKRQF